jgi:hypothetical protein
VVGLVDWCSRAALHMLVVCGGVAEVEDILDVAGLK